MFKSNMDEVLKIALKNSARKSPDKSGLLIFDSIL